MKYLILLFTFYLSALPVWAQMGQYSIDRIAEMPDIPAPYHMRNWKEVAVNYDNLIFSTAAMGEYLPLIGLKPNGVNYPELSPILLQTYVGSNSSNQAEAINIIPAIVGASLVGINKASQAGRNWVEKTKDFFNQANGQHVYLNGYSSMSGGDWWYDVMPNIFFYQLYNQYPDIIGFDQQFISVADRWLAAVHAMGGKTTPWTVPDMDYRAWDLITMTGNSEGVMEPEAAGGIAWLLYQAYQKTHNAKYLDGAQLCLEFLSGLDANPSYELQLPYGAFIAAKMNAQIGTSYDVSKLINWCFDRGPLRGWGAIAGNWNGSDVHGLIGEANDSGNDYAFTMNGFQQVAALVPLIKYDKRYARAIAKWTLNVANASRLFYSKYLPEVSQDDYTWSSTNDPNSVIAYEALKEVWHGNPLYGTGDAKRNGWAETNLGLYGSSHVGYLGAVIEPANVEGILLLDLNKTDFFEENDHPAYVLYNPYSENKEVSLAIPAGSFDIYNAISETTIKTGVTGTVSVTIKADEAMLLVYVPAGTIPVVKDGKVYVGDQVIDYHHGYDFSPRLRIKSLGVVDTLVEFNQQVPIYVTVENKGESASYVWQVNGEAISTSTDPFTWTVPEKTGRTVLKLQIASEGQMVRDSIVFNVAESIPTAPVINAVAQDKMWYVVGSEASLTCEAQDDDDTTNELDYHWIVSAGSVTNMAGATLTWIVPQIAGIYEVTCEVTDQDGLKTTATKLVLVKQSISDVTRPFAYYPMDGNAKDHSGNGHDGQMTGVDAVNDVRGQAGKAFYFDSGTDLIAVDNSTALNFRDKITLSFWVKLGSLNEESFILSHGSWEERWKVSVTPDSRLRWTVKTDHGTTDLDSSFPLELNKFYHFTVVYSGYAMEIYADGLLDNFVAQTGLIGLTNKPLTMGRKDDSETSYFLSGTLDEVRVYNAILAPEQIRALPETWNIVTGVDHASNAINVYPNPSPGIFYINGIDPYLVKNIELLDLNGRSVNFTATIFSGYHKIILHDGRSTGLLILKIQTSEGIFYRRILVVLVSYR